MNRAIFYIAISFALSCAGLIFLPQILLYLAVFGAILLAASLILRLKAPWRGRCFLLCAGLMLAIGTIQLHTLLYVVPFSKLEGQTLQVSGVVSGVDQRDSYCLVTLRATVDTPQSTSSPPESEMRIFTPGVYDYQLGDKLIGLVEFSTPRDEGERRYMYSHGQYISGYSEGDALRIVENFDSKNPPNSLFVLGIYLRGAMIKIISELMPGQNGNFVASVLLGEGDMLPQEVSDNMYKTGAGHVLAVSGLHLSVVCGSILRLLARRGLGKWPLAIIGGLISLFVATLVGFSPSVMRAGLMLTLTLIGEAVGRKSDGLNGLGLAVVGIGLFSPYTLLSWSLLISVTSILAIFTFSVPLERALISWRKNRYPKLPLLDNILCSVGLTLGVIILTRPLFALLRGSFANYEVLGNLLIVPLSMLILLLGGGMTLLGALELWGLAELLMVPTSLCVDLVLGCAEFIASLPGVSISITHTYELVWMWGSGLILALVVSCGIKLNFSRILMVCSSLVLVLFVGIFSHKLIGRDAVMLIQFSGSNSLGVVGDEVWLLSGDLRSARITTERGHNIALVTQGDGPTQDIALLLSQYSPAATILHRDTAREISPYIPSDLQLYPTDKAVAVKGDMTLEWREDFQILHVGGVEILKLSDGYDIMESSVIHDSADVIITSDQTIHCQNPSLRLRSELWGEKRIVFIPY